MAAPRSTQLVVIGVAVFVIGAGLVYMGLSDDDAPKAAASPTTASTPKGSATVSQTSAGGQKAAIIIPQGMQAVAIELQGAPALSGYIRAGDRVNVHATVNKEKSARLDPPFAKLVLSGVTVLDVRGVETGGRPMYVLALDQHDAEKVIYFAKFESLWLTLQPPQQGPVATRGYAGRL